jgi:hypothetical protein
MTLIRFLDAVLTPVWRTTLFSLLASMRMLLKGRGMTQVPGVRTT